VKFIFCYDISDNKTLYKVSKELEKVGIRVQYSVFEVDTTAEKANQILKRISSLINPDTDRIFMYPIEKRKKEIERVGKSKNITAL